MLALLRQQSHHLTKSASALILKNTRQHFSNAVLQRRLVSGSQRYESNGISLEFGKFQKSQESEAIELLTSTFLNHEPMTNYLQSPLKALVHFNTVVVDRSLRDDISTVAIDTKLNRVIGFQASFLISSPNEKADFDESAEILEPLQPITDILARVQERIFQLDKVKTIFASGEKCMELFMVGVSDGYHGHGILKQLLHDSVELGKSKGAKMVYTKLTGPVSQHIFAKAPGFAQIGDVEPYTTFESRGHRPFRDMPPENKGIVICVKQL
ncbi:uncharacterized protein [Ptychodera flava]|uniref:uncharacterized protein n=1 Tax=Ptychodera flava TaxID=63121 RepID=UPI00396A8E20